MYVGFGSGDADVVPCWGTFRISDSIRSHPAINDLLHEVYMAMLLSVLVAVEILTWLLLLESDM
jgi:hypothetical protein